MNKQIKKLFIFVGLLLGIGGVSAYALTEVTVENKITTGIIDIELNEYTIKNGNEVLWNENGNNILPGQDIYKIPRITNYGNDCYIRTKISFINSPLDEDDLYGMTDQWIAAKDGYYYYKGILFSQESVDLFQGIHVPENLDIKTAESLFNIQIDIDAIQSDNFIPDYSLDQPWGNVEVLNCEKEGMYDISTFEKEKYLDFKISYKGDSGRLFNNEDDFFDNFPVLLPGDYYEDELTLNNESDKNINLYFRTQTSNSDLLECVQLKIIKQFKEKDTIIYEGSLNSKDLNNNQLLANLKSGETGKLRYEISVPETLNNDYTLMEESVMWIFSTEPIVQADAVQTGDISFLVCAVMMMIGGIFLLIGIKCGNSVKARKKRVQ